VLLIAMGVGAFLPAAGVGFEVACAIIGTDAETQRDAGLSRGPHHHAPDRCRRAVVDVFLLRALELDG
jgi:hypothetical protein